MGTVKKANGTLQYLPGIHRGGGGGEGGDEKQEGRIMKGTLPFLSNRALCFLFHLSLFECLPHRQVEHPRWVPIFHSVFMFITAVFNIWW